MVVEEFSRLQRERVNEAELEAAQDYAVGHFPLTIETPDQLATQVLNQLFYELPVEDLPKYPRAGPRACRPTTSSAWRAGSSSGRISLSVVLVGNADQFVGSLKGAGFGDLRAHSPSTSSTALGRPQEAVKVMLSCGEPSGDLYAGALVRRCARASRSSTYSASAARSLAGGGCPPGGGLPGPLGHRAHRGAEGPAASSATYTQLVAAAREHRPDVLVLIDYPDFNFRLMSAIKALGIPIVYYISPQLWAWRPGRMKTMKALVDRVLVIFPVRGGALPAGPAWMSASSAIRCSSWQRRRRQAPRSLREFGSTAPSDRGAAAGQPAQRAGPPGVGAQRGRWRNRSRASPACSSSSPARRICRIHRSSSAFTIRRRARSSRAAPTTC